MRGLNRGMVGVDGSDGLYRLTGLMGRDSQLVNVIKSVQRGSRMERDDAEGSFLVRLRRRFVWANISARPSFKLTRL